MAPRANSDLQVWCLICDKMFASDHGWCCHMGKVHKVAWRLRPYATRAAYLHAMALEKKR